MKEISKKRMLDVIFEVTGNPGCIANQLQFLRERGRQIILSSPRGPSTLNLHDLVNRPSRMIIGAHNASHPPVATIYNQWTKARNIELFFDLLLAREMTVLHLITHRCRWDKAADIYQMLLEDRSKSLGIVFSWKS